ncbi:MAG: GNAT family N-acetyltransferase [Prevotellaceae bacterium]|jgi:GNAT superfamily N-acetyltransferase|nr:GNAT family N-acetyltransferase [Prevotellaceae bacterium]
MVDLRTQCEFVILSAERLIAGFDCGDTDLNEFFNHEALHYKEQLLAQTGFFRHYETGEVVCAFSLSPNALKIADLPGSRRKKVREYIPREKSLQSYPAFLIGRFGVALTFRGQGIGAQLMDFIKIHCLITYPDFCRFLLIDAYNNSSVLNFYQKNNFSAVFSSEEQERDAYKMNVDEPLRTRYLFFDMIHWKNKSY